MSTFLHPQNGGLGTLAIILTLVLNTQTFFPAEPDLLEPEQLLIVPDGASSPVVRFALPLSYVNTGPLQSKAVIRRESISYTLNSKTRRQHWQSFENFKYTECKIETPESADTHPLVLAGGDAASHVTYFAARVDSTLPDANVHFQSWADFAAALSAVDEITFTIRAEVLNGEDLVEHCRVKLDSYDKQRLGESCYLALTCYPKKSLIDSIQ